MAKEKKVENQEKNERQQIVNANDIRKMLNKKAGFNVSFSLKEENPSEVKEWIPTGSGWLDRIICKGKVAGIPVGKITEIAGLESCVTEDTEIEIMVDE